MSGKRFNPLHDPPTASSSDEDELETSIGEGEEIERNSSSEEEEEEYDDFSRNAAPDSTENQDSDIESDPEEEEEYDSDSEPERKALDPNHRSSVVKSISETVPNQVSIKVKPLTKTPTKHSSSEPDAKRVKRVSGEETKKTYFQRVWSQEDEIVVLQGMIDYKTDNGSSPYGDMNTFYELVKKSIGFDVSKNQLKEKLRNLKKKYENNLAKGKKGEDPTFSKPHDLKAFELSKCIWGANGIALDNEKSKKKSFKSKKVESVNVKQELVSSLSNGKSFEEEMACVTELDTMFMKSLARFGVDDIAAQQGWSKLASEDKKRFEEQWKAMQLREFELYSEKSGFIHQVVAKMAEAFRSNP